MEYEYFSQSGEDVIIAQAMPHEHGFFVDIGASDGIRFSNTYHFEKHKGWNGLCVEAFPDYIPELKKNRKCSVFHAAVGSVEGPVTLYSNRRGSLSTLDKHKHVEYAISFGSSFEGTKEITVGGWHLDVLLRSFNCPRIFDLLSIDVEGTDHHVIERLLPYRPKVVIIEVDVGNQDQIMDILAGYKYHYVRDINGNRIFTSTETMKDSVLQASRSGHVVTTTPHPFLDEGDVDAQLIRKTIEEW